jgi:hypothetical protein
MAQKPDATQTPREVGGQPAGRGSAARGETGTDTDALPPPLGTGTGGDVGGIPSTIERGVNSTSPADSDLAVDAGGADPATGRGLSPGSSGDGRDRHAQSRERDRELPNETPTEQLARPGRGTGGGRPGDA